MMFVKPSQCLSHFSSLLLTLDGIDRRVAFFAPRLLSGFTDQLNRRCIAIVTDITASGIERNTVQPSIEIAFAAKRRQMQERFHERVLDDIFRKHRASNVVPHGQIEPILVPLDKSLVAILVSTQRRVDEFSIGDGRIRWGR
jgi:hypothetical protein